MDLLNAINLILENDFLDSDECEESKCENIEALIPLYGWEAVQEILLRILLGNERKIHDYEVAAQVFWGAVLDCRDISPINKIIALLYYRLVNGGNCSEDIFNLAWSITRNLKKVDYLSEYDPLDDLEIIEEMNSLKK
jgi:hypothetical protein